MAGLNPSRSRPTDRPDAHCPDCPFSDRGDWVMYRSEYDALIAERDGGMQP